MTVDTGSGSMPIAAFSHAGSLVIATDDGAWLRLGAGESLEPMTPTGPMSDVVAETDGTVTVACWSPELRQLRQGAWSTISLSAPATALAATPRGIVIADTGRVLSLLSGAARMPVQELTSPEPILSLVWVGSLVALGASGTVEVSTWPVVEGGLVPLHTGTIGRAHAIFAGIRPGSALVAGARGIATLDHTPSASGTRPRIAAVTTDLKERVSGAVVFTDRQRALVYADSGDAWIVDEGLVRATPVRLSAGVIGAAPSGDGSVLAWTADGALHTIGSDGATWRVTGDGVVLAAADPGRTGTVAIHWSKTGGTRVTRGHVAWN
ncbi:MAG: hypothetical protein ACKV2T_34275 [Kofleriaceae bacterium]